MAEERNFFEEFVNMDVSKWVEKKQSIDYLEWAAAVTLLKNRYPLTTFDVHKTESGRPWFTDTESNSGWVTVTLKIPELEFEQTDTLAIMDLRNQPLSADKCNSVTANKSIRRCLTKVIAEATGIGLTLYGKSEGTLLAPYAEKSYWDYRHEYSRVCDRIVKDNGIRINNTHSSEEYAINKVRRDMMQGFQGWEYKWNTVASSRGDYPFIAVSFGIDKSRFGKMATECILETRKNGQGKEGFKRPVLFAKLTFLYDEELHGEGKELEELFECAIDCSSKCMYPDFLSLSGEGYIPSMYKKYGKVVSLMGCRASLSPWYERGGAHTYAMTAWRSLRVEKLVKMLQEVEWE